MTLETGRNRGRQGGFTLLEICIVLCIIVIILGAALPELSSWLAEERLREPARQLELLARTARMAAIAHRHPVDVVIRPQSLSLQDETADAKLADLVPPYPLSEDFTVLTQPWGEAKLQQRPETRWRFQPNGLCEPLGVKFIRGRSDIHLVFNPLTAMVAEETYDFQQ